MKKGFALAVGVAVLLAGCPQRACPVTAYQDATRALATYRERRQEARVIRAEARVDRRDPEGRIRGTVMMFIERPDRVRFDAMTQFGPAAILTSDGERFALTDLRENRYLAGPTCPENIARLLGFRLSGEEVTRLLLGESPRIEATERTIACHGGSYVVTLRGADGIRQELELEVEQADLQRAPDDQRTRLRRSEIFEADGATRWRVTFGSHRSVDGLDMPFEVRFEDPGRGADTQVRFERIDLNVEVPEDVFTQTPRPGLAVEESLCD